MRFSWLGHSDSHHSLSHEADDDPAKRTQLVQINHWYAEQFAYLLGKLAAQPELDGTLLDNTVVLWVNEQGNAGQRADAQQGSDPVRARGELRGQAANGTLGAVRAAGAQ